jgi:hypothetical protein
MLPGTEGGVTDPSAEAPSAKTAGRMSDPPSLAPRATVGLSPPKHGARRWKRYPGPFLPTFYNDYSRGMVPIRRGNLCSVLLMLSSVTHVAVARSYVNPVALLSESFVVFTVRCRWLFC